MSTVLTSSVRSLRRVGAAIAAVAIAVPALAVTTASAEPTTTWTEGACAEGEGVTVVVDLQGDADPTVRCVTNADDTAYSSTNSLQTFTDAGFEMGTLDTNFGPQVCQINDAPSPNPCDEWVGIWWSFWTGTEADGWVAASEGAHITAAPTDSFIAFSLVDNVEDAPAPRTGTSLAEPAPPVEEPAVWQGDAALAAAWLVKQGMQSDGTFSLVTNGVPNVTFSIDILLAVAAVNPDDPAIPAIWDFIAANANTYVQSGSTDPAFTDGSLAGKLLLAAAVVEADPTDINGFDVLAALDSRLIDGVLYARSTTSRANTYALSLTVIALARAGELTQDVVDTLLNEQCATGAFRGFGQATPCAPGNFVGIDYTAVATQALVAAADAGLDVPDSALTRAGEYLLAQQAASGGWGSDSFMTTPNTNSTGLAVQALWSLGIAPEAIDAARAFVASVQAHAAADADTRLAAELGAIAYDPTAYTRAQTGGLTSLVQWRMATSQGIFALEPVSLDVISAPLFVVEPEPEPTTPTEEPTTPTQEPTTPTQEPTTPTQEPTETDSPTTAPTTSEPTTTAPTTSAPAPGDGLAHTGAEVLPVALVALLLLLAGGSAVVATRRRGAHQ